MKNEIKEKQYEEESDSGSDEMIFWIFMKSSLDVLIDSVGKLYDWFQKKTKENKNLLEEIQQGIPHKAL